MQSLSETERVRIEKRIEAIAKEGQRFERIVVSRDEALAMFTENKFKVCVMFIYLNDTPLTLQLPFPHSPAVRKPSLQTFETVLYCTVLCVLCTAD